MAYLPVALMRRVAKTLSNGEGQAIIYRTTAVTNNVTTGATSSVNTDTPIRAYVGARKRQFIGGSLVRVPGERLLIAAVDLAQAPVVGDTVILAATESAGVRRKVETVKISSAQGLDILYAVEVA